MCALWNSFHFTSGAALFSSNSNKCTFWTTYLQSKRRETGVYLRCCYHSTIVRAPSCAQQTCGVELLVDSSTCNRGVSASGAPGPSSVCWMGARTPQESARTYADDIHEMCRILPSPPQFAGTSVLILPPNPANLISSNSFFFRKILNFTVWRSLISSNSELPSPQFKSVLLGLVTMWWLLSHSLSGAYHQCCLSYICDQRASWFSLCKQIIGGKVHLLPQKIAFSFWLSKWNSGSVYCLVYINWSNLSLNEILPFRLPKFKLSYKFKF